MSDLRPLAAHRSSRRGRQLLLATVPVVAFALQPWDSTLVRTYVAHIG